ncbi:hypothetical protein [Rhodopila sp.]
MDPADLPPLHRLIDLERLFLTGTPISDLTPLSALTELRVLGLRLTRVR